MRHSEVCGILYAPHRNLDGLPFKQLKHPYRSTSFSEFFKSNSWACFIVILQLDIRSAPIFFGKAKDSTSCLFRRFSRAFMTTLFNSSQTVPYHMRTTTQSLHNKTFGKNGLDLSYPCGRPCQILDFYVETFHYCCTVMENFKLWPKHNKILFPSGITVPLVC